MEVGERTCREEGGLERERGGGKLGLTGATESKRQDMDGRQSQCINAIAVRKWHAKSTCLPRCGSCSSPNFTSFRERGAEAHR